MKVLAHRVDNLERSQMRTLVDQLRDKLGSGVVVLGSATNGNVSLIARRYERPDIARCRRAK